MSENSKSALDGMDAFVHRAISVLEKVLGAALIFIVCLNFINVVGRFVFSKTMLGAYEVQIFTMVWMTFLGASAVMLRGENLRMDALVKVFPAWLVGTLRWIELLLMIGLTSFVIWVSSNYALSQLGTSSTVGQIPMVIPHSSVAVGYVLIMIILIRHALRGGKP